MELSTRSVPFKPAIWLAILSMSTVAITVTLGSILFLYRTAYNEQLAELQAAAETLAGIMEAVAQFDRRHSGRDHPQGAQGATLSQIEQGMARYKPVRASQETMLGRRVGETIQVMLLSKSRDGLETVATVAFDGKLAQPLYNALSGKSGSGLFLDYTGAAVLAGYAPVPSLDMGISYKIDLQEMRAPFLRAGLWAGLLALFAIGLGAASFVLIARPLQDRVRQTEQRWQSLVATAPVGVYETDLHGACTFVNTRWCALTGLDPEEALGDGWKKALHTDDREKFFSAWKEFLAGRAPFRLEYRFLRPDGDVVWVYGQATALRDDARNTIGHVSTVTDISVRKTAEQALRRERNFSGTILDHAGALVVVVDREGRVRRFNRAAEQISGRTFAEVEGRFPWDILLPPEDADTIRQQAFEAVVSDPRIMSNHYTNYWLSKGGERYLTEWSNTVLRDAHGQMEFMVCIGTDITERRRSEDALRASEARLRHTQQLAATGSWELDLATDRLTWSEETCRIFGVQSGCPNGTYQTFLDAVHPEDRVAVDRAYQRAIGEHTPYDLTHRIVQPDGTIKWVHERGETFYDDQGEPLRTIGAVQDITARRQLEQSKRDTEYWFQGVYNSIEEAILVVSPDRMLAAINPAAEKMFGYSPDEVKGQSTEIFHVDHDRYLEFGARIRDAFARNETAEFEYQARRRNGEIFPTEHSVSLLRNDAGEVLGIVSVVRDITERKRHEAQINAANQTLSAVLDTTPVLIAHLCPNMNFVRVNTAYAAADNKTPEYFVGKNHFAIYPNAENEAIFRRVVETGVPYVAKARPFEYEHHPERGVTHWDWTLTPIKDDAGKVTGLVLSLLNVTERIKAFETIQRSERQLKELNESLETRVRQRAAELETQSRRNELILGTTLDGFFAADQSGHIRAANPAFCALLGYTQDELLRTAIPDIEANERPEDVAAHIQKVIAHGHDRFDSRHRHKDGSVIDVEVSVNLVELGGERMFYAFVRDITARKQSETALIAAKEAAERANAAKSEFLSRMSHELRTPMNAILGFGQLLEMEPIDVQSRDHVKEILHAGYHLLELINELLDLSRIEAGRLNMTLEAVDVVATLDESLHMVQSLVAACNLRLHNHADQCSARHVFADRTRLRQILVNLLTNATKYNRPQGSIRIGCTERENGIVRLSVTDTGPGIPAAKVAHLFQPFERLGAELTEVPGTGIGLALSRRLAELMGARLGVDTTEGEGSTFWIDLIRAEDATLPAPAAAGIDTADSVTADEPGLARLLYIEDNPANLRLVEQVVHKQPGLNLITATTGRDGLIAARAARPALILLDIHLPDISGYEVLARLRTQPETQDIPVVALSAQAMPHDIEQGLAAGFLSYLTKPLKVTELIAAIHAALNRDTP